MGILGRGEPIMEPKLDTGDSGVLGGDDVGCVHMFLSSLAMIVVSEIGDKTFLIAVVLSMKYSRGRVFAGALLALAFMTYVSAFFGWLVTNVPRAVTRYGSALVFALFGLGMLREGWTTGPGREAEEWERVQAALQGKEASGGVAFAGPPGILEGGVLLEAFWLTLVAEWGDRSQVATLVLAARDGYHAVTLGAVLGHAVCTGMAVLGGRLLAEKISIRMVTLAGGSLFLFFAIATLLTE